MRQFLIKLKKILQCNSFYYLLIIISLIIIFIYSKLYKPNIYFNLKNDNFNLSVKDYTLYSNKISIVFNEGVLGNYYFDTENEKLDLINNISINDKILVYGKMYEPQNNTIFNTFNYKKYLYHNKINYILDIDNYRLLSKNNNILYKLKNNIYIKIFNMKFNSYLFTFILGKSSLIDDDVYNNYKINGITHLFALSGMHVSIFSCILLFILKKMKLSDSLSNLIVIIFLIFIVFISSYTPSLLRALLNYVLVYLNKKYKLLVNDKNIIFLTFFLLIIINPFFIFNIGFELSFIVTFFISIYKCKTILKNSFISLLASFPIVINRNYEINIVSFINNIFFIPYVSYIFFPFTLLTFIIPKLSFIYNLLVIIMERISYFSVKILNLTLSFRKLNYIEIFLYYLFLLKNKKILLLLFLIFIYIDFNKSTFVSFFDVKQGDSIFIKTEDKNILIDVGKNNIKNIIMYFKSKNIRKLDYLVLSHGDYDHMGEAINLVNNFKVEKVIFNCGTYNDLEKKLISLLNEKNVAYYSCVDELNINKYKIKFLNTGDYGNENDNSSVIYLNYNNYKFLFMGDAGLEKEKDILEKYNIQNIDFFKVGHHGSNTSSSKIFINSIIPKYSLISVGKNNRYGHPKDEVLETLKNSKIYRTDLDGSIEIKLNKDGYKIRTCPP